MLNNMLTHLKAQLKSHGIDNPEDCRESPPQEISRSCANMISGGFGQVVGFGQAFSETSGPGPFVQTIFRQQIN